jgi:formylglycine-generating enzyme required for sulfatase activity
MVHQVKQANALSPTYTDPATGMEFVLVKGGCFEMGDIYGDGYKNEKPVHQVCVDDFFMGKLLVTQKQWRAIMGNDPSFFKSCGENCPVEQVSSGDVQDYIRTLNQRSGKNFRLPTEAEWEFAARSGGKKEKWAGTNDQAELGAYAWYSANSGSETHPVGLKKPNGLGLYDMTGNVWEWASDWDDEE